MSTDGLAWVHHRHGKEFSSAKNCILTLPSSSLGAVTPTALLPIPFIRVLWTLESSSQPGHQHLPGPQPSASPQLTRGRKDAVPLSLVEKNISWSRRNPSQALR